MLSASLNKTFPSFYLLYRKEGNVLYNDARNTFYLQLYGRREVFCLTTHATHFIYGYITISYLVSLISRCCILFLFSRSMFFKRVAPPRPPPPLLPPVLPFLKVQHKRSGQGVACDSPYENVFVVANAFDALTNENEPSNLLTNENEPSNLLTNENEPSNLLTNENEPSVSLTNENESSGVLTNENECYSDGETSDSVSTPDTVVLGYVLHARLVSL